MTARQAPGNWEGDLTFISNISGKLHVQAGSSHRLQSLYVRSNKTRNARGANQDLAPESVYRQTSREPGTISVRHTWSGARGFILDSLAYASDANFNLLPQVGTENQQRLVIRETGFTSRGLYASVQEISRPTTEVKTDGSIFLANLPGGDHTTRFGVRYRDTPWQTDTWWTGGAEARLSTRFTAEAGPLGPDQAVLYRPGSNPVGLWTAAAYVQDSFTRGRLRLNAGLRWDYQNGVEGRLRSILRPARQSLGRPEPARRRDAHLCEHDQLYLLHRCQRRRSRAA